MRTRPAPWPAPPRTSPRARCRRSRSRARSAASGRHADPSRRRGDRRDRRERRLVRGRGPRARVDRRRQPGGGGGVAMAVMTITPAGRLPGPPELLPGRPDSVIDLQTDAGVSLVGGEWRYSDARVEEIDFVEVGSAADPLGPGETPNRTFDVVPHAEAVEFDDSAWQRLAPADTMRRLSQGRVCFNWYRIAVTIPERVGDFDPTGATVVFEVAVDDYAEVWVNGRLPLALGL